MTKPWEVKWDAPDSGAKPWERSWADEVGTSLEETPKKGKGRSLLAVANDTVIEAANAAASGVGAIADFVSPGNRFSQSVDTFVKEGEEKQSDVTKADKAAFRADLESSQGIGDDLAAVGRHLATSPLQVAAQAAGSFAGPGLAIGAARGLAGLLGFGAKAIGRAGTMAGVVTGAAMGGGDAAGNAYEMVQAIGDDVLMQVPEVAEMAKSGMSMKDIRHEVGTAAAREASALPAVAGGIAGMFGAEKILAAGGVAKTGAKGLINTTLSEGAQEAIEEGLTQYESQRAAQKYDPSIDPTKNVAAMAALGGATGGFAGAGVHVISKPAPTIEAIGNATNVDEAIAAANAMVDAPVESAPAANMASEIAALEQEAGMVAPAAAPDFAQEPAKAIVPQESNVPQLGDTANVDQTREDLFAQREAELAAREDALRELSAQQLMESGRDLQVEQAAAITKSQGSDVAEQTAMQLAMQRARLKAVTTPVTKRTDAQLQAPIQSENNPSPAAPVQLDTPTGQITPQAAPVIRPAQPIAQPAITPPVPASQAVAPVSPEAPLQSRAPGSNNVSSVQFTGEELGGLDQPIGQLKLKAREFARREFADKTVTVSADGAQILIPWQGIKHTFSGSISKIAAITGTKLDKLIENGAPAGTVADKSGRDNVIAVHYYDTPVTIGGEQSMIRVVVRETTDRKRFYDHFEIREAASERGSENLTGDKPGTSSTQPASEANPNIPQSGEIGNVQERRAPAPALPKEQPSPTLETPELDAEMEAYADGLEAWAVENNAGSLVDEAKGGNLITDEEIDERFTEAGSVRGAAQEDTGEQEGGSVGDRVQAPEGKAESRAIQEAKGGLKSADVIRSLTRLRAKWIGFTKVNTVQSVADLPADLAERFNPDARTEGLYDPQTKSVYLIADNIESTERATWVAAHEVVGHGGLRMLRDKSVNEALNLAGQNRFIFDMAKAIKQDRPNASEQVAVEEAIAELSAAIETDDFQSLTDRYGVDVPASALSGIKGMVARVYETVKRFLATVFGKPVDGVSDADVRGLISAMQEAVGSTESQNPARAESSKVLASKSEPDNEQPLESRTPSQVKSIWESPEPSKIDDLIYTMQDKQVDLRRVVAAIRGSVGNIADKWDAYLQEELFHGRTAKRVMDFQTSELRPLMQEMQMRKVEIPEFEEYLHNRHAEERNNQIAKVNPDMLDGGSGIDTADARTYLANLPVGKKRAYEALANRVDAINKRTRQLLVDSGLEKPETVAAWDGAYQYYVPLQREESGAGIGQGFSVRGSASKRATGSKRDVVNVLANLVMQRERTIVRAEKNRVGIALYGLAIQSPNTGFWLPVNPEKATQKVADELANLGMNPLDAQNLINEPKQTYIDQRTGLVAERVNPILRSAKNVMATRVGGEDRYIFFNDNDERAMRMVTAMKNLDADQLGRVLSVSAMFTRYFASINTQYNPIFGAINLIRDTQGALLNLSTTPIRGKQKEVLSHVASALRGIYIDVRNRRAGKESDSQWADLYEEFQRHGGQTGYRDMFSNSEARAEALRRELDSDAWADSKFGKVFTADGSLKVPMTLAVKTVKPIFDWLSDYNQSMENAVRLASYKVAKDSGMPVERAASLAKNISVNFNRKGQVATQAGALYAFFNASVQGSARLIETLRGPAGKKIITGGLLLGSMQALLLAAAGFDDDEPPEFVRSRNLIIPTGDGKYLTLAMPLGFHVLPNIGRISTEFVMSGFKNPTKRLFSLIDLLTETFNPIGSAGLSIQTVAPTALDPFVAITENKDWSGKQIAKESFSSSPSPGYLRAKDTATSFGKIASYWINRSTGGTDYKAGEISPTPDQIDYLVGQAFGGVGREAQKVEQTIASAFTGEDLPPHKIPLAGRFYGDTKGPSAVVSRFYDNLKEINVHEAEIKGRRKDRGDVLGYMREHPESRLVAFANSVERDVRALQQRKRELLAKESSKERIKLVEMQITARMQRLNDRVKTLEEKRSN